MNATTLPLSLVRAARLAALPLATVGDAARARVRAVGGEPLDSARANARARSAERTRRTLGRMKGGPQKAGQLLSTVDALLPQDPDSRWAEAVAGLQERGEPVPFDVLEPVVRAEWGRRWWQAIALEDEPVAAASIGQVYRGTTSSGRAVAVKIQYPGVADALRGDLAVFSAVSRLASVVAPGVALPPLVGELRRRLVEELDYLHEAGVQRRFRDAYIDDAEVFVPDVVAATPRVLVTEWLDAVPLVTAAATADAPARDRIALRYQRFMLGSPMRCGLLHTDPHPGNFRVLDDGRLGVLDFGSSLDLPGGLPASFGRLVAALRATDDETVEAALREHGLLRPGRQVEITRLRRYLEPFAEPARHEQFTYSPEWLRSTFGRVDDPRNPDFAVAMRLDLPAEHLFTHRVWLGVLGVLCRLRATVPVRSELERLLPGFA